MDLPNREMEEMMEEKLVSSQQDIQEQFDFSAIEVAEEPVITASESTPKTATESDNPVKPAINDYADLNFKQEIQEALHSLAMLIKENKELMKQFFSSFKQIGIAFFVLLKFWLKNTDPFLKKERKVRMKRDHQLWKTLSETKAHFHFEKQETSRKRWKLGASFVVMIAALAVILNFEKFEEPIQHMMNQTRVIVPKLEIKIPDSKEASKTVNEEVVKEKKSAEDETLVLEGTTGKCELSTSQIAWIKRKYNYLKKYTPEKEYSLVHSNRCNSQYDGVIYLANGESREPVALVKFRKDYNTLEEFIIVEMEKFEGGKKPAPYIGSIVSTRGPFNYIARHLRG
ncbi:MAG: hypothetical protein HQM14_05720 [SAR324 cluster bacterium]|nr:hypothetical protein [SAR324 cluster bacterium]